jgi:hypothetical protein
VSQPRRANPRRPASPHASPAAGNTPAADKDAAAAPAPPLPPDTFTVTKDAGLVFRLQAGNRMYPDWKEEHRVHLGESFPLGDTENSAVVVSLAPDFRIVDGKPRSVSDRLDNPAVRIFVYRQAAAVDSMWAFLNFPPHFSPKSFFTFQLLELSGYRGDPKPVTSAVLVPPTTEPGAAAAAPPASPTKVTTKASDPKAATAPSKSKPATQTGVK